MKGACRIDSSKKSELTEAYTALHEGKTPDEFLCEDWSKPRSIEIIGHATEIQYKKKVPEGAPFYHHPWAEQAQPTIAVARMGGLPRQLVFYAGKNETTRRGIEDRVLPGMPTVKYLQEPHVQKEKLPSKPTALITIGTLDWIRYKTNTDYGTGEKELRFNPSNAPDIARDQFGNLHVLGGHYKVNPVGEIETMRARHSRRARKHHGLMMHHASDNPRGRHHHARKPHHRHHRANPVTMTAQSGESQGEKAMRMVMFSAVVGGVATVTAVGLNLVLNQSFASSLQPPIKAAIKIGVGLLGGVGLGYIAPAPLAAGVGIGGVVDGLLDVYNLYVAPMLQSVTTQAPAATLPASTPGATTPGASSAPASGQQALLPSGLPRTYQGVSPAACGVRS